MYKCVIAFEHMYLDLKNMAEGSLKSQGLTGPNPHFNFSLKLTTTII
jgi:hypothetical protein